MINGRLLALVRKSDYYIGLIVLINWISLLCSVAAVGAIGYLLQQARENTLTGSALTWAASIVLIAIAIRFACHYGAAMRSYRVSVNAKKELRSRIYRKLLRLGSTYTEKASTAEVIQLAVEGVEQLETYFGRYLPQLFYSLLAPVTLFALLSWISLKAAVILLICVPLIPLSIIAVVKIAKKIFSKYWRSYSNLGNAFLENLQGLTTLEVYGADKSKHEEMNAAAERFRRMTMSVLTMQLNSVAVMDLIAYGGSAAGIIIAGLELAAGNIQPGAACLIILLSAEFFLPMRLLGSYFHIAMNGMAASGKIFKLPDWPEEERKNGNLQGADIRFHKVGFLYGGNEPALQDITLDIPQGGFAAIVGESGSGKSTLAALLQGARKGYGGSLTIGGTEVRKAGEESLMQAVTLVSYNSYIFKGSVEDNLRMGAPDASEGEMFAALRSVKLDEFILRQGGLSWNLEEQGSNLSGGQRQRLALARGLLHDSSIYVFDEATSNIDAESEEIIMEVIRSLAGSKTVIVISHRLANVVEADQIIVVHAGKIVECGTHKQLLEKNGQYARLFSSQHAIENFGRRESVYA